MLSNVCNVGSVQDFSAVFGDLKEKMTIGGVNFCCCGIETGVSDL